MRLQQFINEAENINDFLENVLLKECSQFIKATKKMSQKYLYRGMKEGFDFKKFVPYKDRKPRDTNEILHKQLDKAFNEIYGWKVRSQGVFTTGSIWEAKKYGDAFLFFPANRYKYIWSPEIDDLTEYVDSFDWALWFFNGKPDEMVEESYFDEYPEKMTDGYDDAHFQAYRKKFDSMMEEEMINDIYEIVEEEYKNNQLKQAIQSGSEVVFNCKHYYLVNSRHLPLIEEIMRR